jgi:hypothetical protein
MQPLDQAVLGLEQALTGPHGFAPTWPQAVRQRLDGVREALHAEHAHAGDLWLSARAGSLHRERNRLLTRVQVLIATLGDGADPDGTRQSLFRLTQDLEHHRQRVSDLMYDGVAMDVGGSE